MNKQTGPIRVRAQNGAVQREPALLALVVAQNSGANPRTMCELIECYDGQMGTAFTRNVSR